MTADPTVEKPKYGWDSQDPTEAHAYVFPAVVKMLGHADGLRILDLGCGNGWTASRLADLGHKVTGIDASVDGLQLATAAYPTVRFLLRNIYDDLSEFEEAFDAVVSTEVIEHLYQPSMLVRQAKRVLKPGGTLVISTPYHGYLKNLAISLVNGWDSHHTVDWDGGHIKFFSKATLRGLLEREGMQSIRFLGSGRVAFLWKSLLVRAVK